MYPSRRNKCVPPPSVRSIVEVFASVGEQALAAARRSSTRGQAEARAAVAELAKLHAQAADIARAADELGAELCASLGDSPGYEPSDEPGTPS